jgi:hypothetical protein
MVGPNIPVGQVSTFLEVDKPKSAVSAELRRLALGGCPSIRPPEPVRGVEQAATGGLKHLEITKLDKVARVGHRMDCDRRQRERCSAGSACTSRAKITRA